METRDYLTAARNFVDAGDIAKVLEHCAAVLKDPFASLDDTLACIDILISIENLSDARLLCKSALKTFPSSEALRDRLAELPSTDFQINAPQANQQKLFWRPTSYEQAKFGKTYNPPGMHQLSEEEKDARWEKDTRSVIEVMRSDVPLRADWHVLDVGCGVGRLIKPLRSVAEQVDGADICEEMIEFSAQYLEDAEGRGEIKVNSGFDLQAFKTEQYDFVFSLHLFEHIRSRANTTHLMREIRRVLKDGGYFWLQVHEDNGNYGDAYGEGLSFINYEFLGNGYSHNDLRDLLEGLGFFVQFIRGEDYWVTALCQK